MLHVLLAISVGEMQLWQHQIKEEMLTSALLDIIVQKEQENQTIVHKEHLEMTQVKYREDCVRNNIKISIGIKK